LQQFYGKALQIIYKSCRRLPIMRPFVFLTILSVILGLSFSVDVSSCQVINAGGIYTLNQSIVSGSSQPYGVFGDTCIGINTSNVVLNCAGFTIDAGTSSMAEGVIAADSESLSSLNNITIANCTVTGNFSIGVKISNVENSTVINNRVDSLTGVGGTGFLLDSQNTGTMVTDNTAGNLTGDGFDMSGASGFNTLIGNIAHNSSGGFEIDSDSNNLTNNIAYNNSNAGFHVDAANNTLLNNTAYNDSIDNSFYGGFFVECCSAENNTLINNTAHSNFFSGIHQYYSIGNVYTGNTAYNNSEHGIFVEGDPATLISNTAYNNSINGFYLLDSAFTNFTNNTAYNNTQHGFHIDSSNNNILANNTAFNNVQYGIELDFSDFNVIDNNTLYDNNRGIDLDLGSDENNITFNIVFNTTGSNGISISASTLNLLVNNTANNTGASGFYTGFASGSNTLIDNVACNNAEDGYDFDTFNNTLTSNLACNNGEVGFHFDSANDNVLTDNTAYGNVLSGIKIEFGNNTMVSGGHLYNNNPDFTFETGILLVVNLSAVIFDNPAGDFTNYTNISLNASNDDDVLTLNWSAEPAPLPGLASFANKHLNITGGSLVTLDSVVWHWLDSEPGAVNEANFELWKYNGTWNQLNTTPDTAGNTLSISNLSSFSVFSILQTNDCPAPVTSPGSYSLGVNVEGAPNDASEVLAAASACVKIAAPDVIFDCNGFSISNNGTNDTTFGILLNTSATNVTVMNCPSIDTNYSYGVYLFEADLNRINNVTAFNDTNGFGIEDSDSNNITDSSALNNTGRGFNIFSNSVFQQLTGNNATGSGLAGFAVGSGSDNTFLMDNIASFSVTDSGFEVGGIFGGSSNNIFINNMAHDNNGTGFTLVGLSDNNTLTGNSAFDNVLDGFFLQTSTFNNFTGNNASGNGQSGYIFQVSSDDNMLTDNVAENNVDEGFRIIASSNVLTGNNATGNGFRGFTIEFGSFNVFTGNLATGNSVGFGIFSGSTFNNITSNNGSGNTGDGMFITGASENNIIDPSIFCNNGGNGLTVDSSDNNVVMDSVFCNNTVHGVSVEGSTNVTVASNNATDNGESGFRVTSDSNVFTDNIALDNNVGFNVSGSSNNLTGNTANDSAMQGFLLETGSGSVLISNFASGNADPGFLIRFGSTGNILSSNTAENNSNTGFFLDSGSNNLTSNTALLNTGAGFFLNSIGNILSSNNATQNIGPGFYAFSGGSSTVFSDNLAVDNDEEGFLVKSDSNTFSGDMATVNTDGFLLTSGADSNTLTDVNASANLNDGLSINASNGNVVDPSFFCNNAGNGITINGSTGTSVMDSVACNNAGDGIALSGSDGNAFTDNDLYNNSNGFTLSSSDSNNFTGNEVFDSFVGAFDAFEISGSNGNSFTLNDVFGISAGGANAFGLSSADNNTFTSNSIFNMSGGDADGFDLDTASGNIFTGNAISTMTGGDADGFDLDTASGNAFASNNISGLVGGDADGFDMDSASSNNFTANTISGDFGGDSDGFDLDSSDSNVFTANVVNALTFGGAGGNDGFDIDSSDSNALSGNTVFDNEGSGVSVTDSTGTTLASDHLYNNTPDFDISGTGVTVSLSGVIFDSPGGTFTNYTNLSVNDTVASAYSIDHATQPAFPLPAGTGSFAGKFVNITNVSGNVSVDSVLWHWLDSEVAAGSYSEGLFHLYLFDGSGWLVQNTSPDTGANTLGFSPTAEFGIYAILQANGTGNNNNPSEGGGEGLDMQLAPLCNGFVITVKKDGAPVENAFVEATDDTHSSEFTPVYTNSEGKAYYSSCDIDVTATATKSGDDGDISEFAACGICVECTTNEQCASNEQCLFGNCVPVQCTCGQVSEHQCVSYQCCSDAQCPTGQSCQNHQCKPQFECDLNGPGTEDDNADCGNNQYCDVPEGQAGGSCKDVTGQCGYASNHAWAQYECGPELGCPNCPEGQECSEHQCVQKDILCPDAGVVGKETTCKATTDGQPCPLCDLLITGPDGKTFTGKTGPDGSFGFPLKLTGIYKVAILDANGNVIKVTQIKAQAGAPPEGGKPTTTGTDPFALLWLLILIALIVIGIIYWRRRSDKKSK
jgi:parallel beta-helix repeat protein